MSPIPLDYLNLYFRLYEDYLVRLDRGKPEFIPLIGDFKRTHRSINVKTKTYPIARIVFALKHQIEPGNFVVDHIDTFSCNDRPDNLRLRTRGENSLNIMSTLVATNEKLNLYGARLSARICKANSPLYVEYLKKLQGKYVDIRISRGLYAPELPVP